MSMEYVRRCYGVPAKRGMAVRVDGKRGIIVRASHYIHVRFDGQKRSVPCHPTWRVEYGTEAPR